MKYGTIKRLLCLVLLGLFAFQANGTGLTEYLQNPEAAEITTNTLINPAPVVDTDAKAIDSINATDSEQLKNIIELVVAGIVAAALIIVVLVLFLGRWLAGKEKKLIKELRMEAEENSDEINSTAKKVKVQEVETSQITEKIRNQATELSTQQASTEQYFEKIQETADTVKEHEEKIDQVTSKVSENMSRIQKYWDSQVNETVDTLSAFQHNLSEKMDFASEGLDQINEKKVLSDELLQGLLDKYNKHNSLLENNSDISTKISGNLTQAFSESNSLLELIQKQQKQAETYLEEYSTRIHNFEEQAYEQFDSSFQVADLARQELSSNLDENRKHIETMRRQEEQSHSIYNQISKNLETLDYSKIVKISETLDNTQDMFDEIPDKVQATRSMLEELKQIEQEIKQTADNVENVARNQTLIEEQTKGIDQRVEATEDAIEKQNNDVLSNPEDHSDTDAKDNTAIAISEFKMASGDSSTPLSFFRNAKNNINKKQHK